MVIAVHVEGYAISDLDVPFDQDVFYFCAKLQFSAVNTIYLLIRQHIHCIVLYFLVGVYLFSVSYIWDGFHF